MFRYVQVSGKTVQAEAPLRIRIYHAVKSPMGPDMAIVGNYNDFVILYGGDELARFLLDKGYELLCHRVAYALGPANCSKYIRDGKERFLQDTGRYLGKSLLYGMKGATYTYHIYIDPESDDFDYIYVTRNNLLKTSGTTNNYLNHKIGFFSLKYRMENDVESIFRLNPDKGVSIFGDKTYKKEGESIENDVVDFLRGVCTLDVEDVGYHHYLVSCDTPGLQISVGGKAIQIVGTSSDYYNRIIAGLYREDKVISISSKYDTANSDITVKVRHSNFDEYIFDVEKRCGDYTYTENYECSIPDIAKVINLESKVIQIELFNILDGDDYKDISGTYKLEGTFGYYDEMRHRELLEELELEENDLPQCDVFFGDSSEIGLIFRKKYPNALMFSKDNIGMDSNLSISPDRIWWYADGLETSVGVFLLDHADSYVTEMDKEEVRLLADPYSIIGENLVNETSYAYEIEDLHGNIKGKRYSLRYLLTRAMIFRVLGEITGSSKSEVENILDQRMEQISELTGSIASYDITSSEQKGRTLTIKMDVAIDNRIFTKYALSIEVVYS